MISHTMYANQVHEGTRYISMVRVRTWSRGLGIWDTYIVCIAVLGASLMYPRS
ncbi:hypothetical protein BR93DRAFT_628248 [Coniochaeta sp. PMI_546]|nr:hypothetical protein BR93DRAFT_628248 [Coniochaeta sp. PMI_546]